MARTREPAQLLDASAAEFRALVKEIRLVTGVTNEVIADLSRRDVYWVNNRLKKTSPLMYNDAGELFGALGGAAMRAATPAARNSALAELQKYANANPWLGATLSNKPSIGAVIPPYEIDAISMALAREIASRLDKVGTKKFEKIRETIVQTLRENGQKWSQQWAWDFSTRLSGFVHAVERGEYRWFKYQDGSRSDFTVERGSLRRPKDRRSDVLSLPVSEIARALPHLAPMLDWEPLDSQGPRFSAADSASKKGARR